MFNCAILKLGLDRAVLEHLLLNTEDDDSIDGTSMNKSKSKIKIKMQAKEIDEILEKVDYDVFRVDDDTEVQHFWNL